MKTHREILVENLRDAHQQAQSEGRPISAEEVHVIFHHNQPEPSFFEALCLFLFCLAIGVIVAGITLLGILLWRLFT